MTSWYLGGDQQTMGQIMDRARRVLAPRPALDLGWPWQCRCGGTSYVKYRSWFYCPRDGKRVVHPDVLIAGRRETFRQAWARVCAAQPDPARFPPASGRHRDRLAQITPRSTRARDALATRLPEEAGQA